MNRVRIAISFFILALFSCSGENPSVEGVESFSVSGYNFITKSIGVNYDVVVYNPKSIQFTLSKVDMEIFINDKRIGNASSTKSFTLAAKDNSTINIDQKIEVPRILKILKDQKNSSVKIKVEQNYHLFNDNLFFVIPYTYEGDIDLEKLISEKIGLLF